MAKESTKCPMCGTKLKMTDGKLTCKKCGYYIRSQPEQTGAQSSYQTSGSYQSSASGQQSTSDNGYRSSGSYSAPKKNKESNPAAAIISAVCLGTVSVAALTGIVLFKAGALNHLLLGDNPRNSSSSYYGNAESSADSSVQESETFSLESESQTEDLPESEEVRWPQSDFFRQVSEAIWGKAYRTITAQEYASLTALQINRDEKTLLYQLDNGETQSLTYQTDIGMDLADLASFTGLEWISVDDDLDEGDLDGLNQLYGVYAENTLGELADIIPNPENITDLGAYDSIFERNIDKLTAFPNLLYLDLNYESLEDITVLSQFPDLRGLVLTDCDDINDYSPLMNLTNLETLGIQSTQLKSIDFITQMPSLTSLSIEDTQVSNLSALDSCPGITYLSLIDNYEIQDYSAVSRLTQLTDLTLEMNYGGTLPSLAELNQLQWLTIKYAGDLSPLKDATSVTSLSLDTCSGWELDSVTAMQGLNTLIIKDFSSYVDSLAPLTQLPNLTALSLEGTPIFGNIEEIFGIPTLQYLYLDDCQVGLNFDSLPTNETLELLSMSDISILKDPTYNNGDEVRLSEHLDMFDHFPNLTELHLASLKLDDIAFVEKLPKLQYLDITDNSVTSLKPLESLSDFQAVWCGRNTILENLPEDSPVFVFTEDFDD